MATTTYGTPYVQSSDLVSSYPGTSSTLASRIDAVSYAGNGLNNQTGTSYTLVLTDVGKTVTLSNASAVAVSIPSNASVAAPLGSMVRFCNLGEGTVTISPAGGVTLNGGNLTLTQFAAIQIVKLATDTWGVVESTGSASGLVPVTPTSIATSGGSSSLSGNTVTFTGVSSVSVNGCFSSTYSAYRLLATLTAASANGINMSMRMRTSGSDNTASEYNNNSPGLTTSGAASNLNAGSGTSWALAAVGTTIYVWGLAADVVQPFAAATTYLLGGRASYAGGGAEGLGGAVSAHHFGATSFDGFSLIASTGNVTGSIKVFGYK